MVTPTPMDFMLLLASLPPVLMPLISLYLVPELPLPTLATLMLPWLTARDLPMLSPRLMLLTLVTATPTLMPEFPSAPALDWTQSPRDLTPPPRDMSLTTDMDTMPMDTTMARGLLRLRLIPRLIPLLLLPMVL